MIHTRNLIHFIVCAVAENEDDEAEGIQSARKLTRCRQWFPRA